MPELKQLVDLGGWAAFLAVVLFGGRAFLSLARSFAGEVVAELRAIKDEIAAQREAVATLAERLEQHGDQLDRIESQNHRQP